MPETSANPDFVRQLRRASDFLAFFSAAIGVLTWVGWLAKIDILASSVPGWPTMKPITATLFIAAAALLHCIRHSVLPRKLLLAGGLFLLFCSLLALVDSMTHFGGPKVEPSSAMPLLRIPMAPVTGCVLSLFAGSLWALAAGKIRTAQYLALVDVCFGLFFCIGVSYRLGLFSSSPVLAGVSLNTALATVCMGLALLFARPEEGITRLFALDVSGVVLRRTLPFVIGAPILFGWIRLKGEEQGWYEAEVGVALFVVTTILLFAAIISGLARHLQRAETGRRKAMEVIEEREEQLRIEHAELLEVRHELADHNRKLEETVAQRTAQLKATIRSLETFVYAIPHDLRAPLRAMAGFSMVLKEEHGPQLNKSGQEYCDRIAAAANRLDKMLADLVAYGRLSHTQISSLLVDLNTEIEAVVSHLRERPEYRKAEFQVQTPLPKVCAEPKILNTVLENLLSNAVKFVPPGWQAKVRVRAEGHDGRIRLWVEDNGIGIAREHQQRIFRLFERLHPADEYPGTGIGLAIVKTGVEQMHGAVGLESEIGKGSRFWIELPGERMCAA